MRLNPHLEKEDKKVVLLNLFKFLLIFFFFFFAIQNQIFELSDQNGENFILAKITQKKVNSNQSFISKTKFPLKKD